MISITKAKEKMRDRDGKTAKDLGSSACGMKPGCSSKMVDRLRPTSER